MHGKTVVEVGADGVAVVAINNPPLNLLTVDVMLSLQESIKGVLPRDDVKAIVITGTNRKFSAGFDVTIFGDKQKKRTKEELGFLSIQFLTDTLEAARKPFVAAIDGPAFGGALEIVLACHARISTSSAKLGLTELQYGIIPGLGGTQRLPRLVGLPKALEMILMSKRVDGGEARVLSLVDAIAPADKLIEVARRWALDIVERTRPWVISLYKTDKLGTLEEARAVLNSARMEVQRRNPNVDYPLVCIDVIKQGIVSDPRDALWTETEAFHELRQSSTCRSLVHFFFAQRQTTKISEMNLLPRNIDKVAVIGGGLMSSEIVALLVLRNYQVILKEKNRDQLLEEINKIRKNLHTHFKYGKTTLQGLEKALTLLKGVLDYDSFEDVDLVIEAECETLSTKQDIFADLEKLCPPNCIFASSSSTFSLELIGERTKCQDRIVGIHFFCLSPAVPLVEIVRTERMSAQAMVDVIEFARKFRRTPIVVSDCNGQGVNSMVITYLHAATLLAELGVDVYQIDLALKSFGMHLGPFRMIDMIGFKAFAEISRILIERLPDRFYKPKLIPVLQNANREGESTCKGFYEYDNSGKASPDPELRKYTVKATSVGNLTADTEAQLRKLSDSEMVEMILFPALNEACRVISDGVVMRPSDLDVASVLAMGFPSYRGGIHYWSNNFDSGYVYSKLKKWSQAYGHFFEPCDYIMERSAKSTHVANERKKLIKSQL
ncbi:glyoxysomal fatty acid beta-oxidation multifunctional protein MFP-a-like isoform X2 [Salvia miltiorrhiza]|uniref:glyoxysomal fatty acid beta-oxidation multifunctional protein MFP-a-like isoform X2 n=1 Tax=Salvia miltiorrhiza TaxID=226208 RepID=UPI0025AB6141|nr:glyoxysomal fatty acid beta-oxidation multifunctional protein MFP-a-like isoform X2 [Salvia miltiorrhiza]